MAVSTVPIHIIYASTGGNTEHVVELVAQHWQAQGVTVQLHRAEQTPISVITEHQFFMFATSTWDHGTLNPFFKVLLGEMKKTDFTGKIASFIGLGDRRYEKHYFCTGMTILKEAWEKNKGTAVGVALTIGREPFEAVIEEMVQKWAADTLPLYQVQQTSLPPQNVQAVPTQQPEQVASVMQQQTGGQLT